MTGPKTSAKRILTILGTLFCALATGFFMQHYMQSPRGEPDQAVQVASVSSVQDVIPLAEQALAETSATQEDIPLEVIELTAGVPAPPSTAPQPELLPDAPITLAALDDQPIADLPPEEPAPSFTCEIRLFAQPSAAAMVKLNVDAACMANERFTVHHGGMMFAMATDNDGLAEFTVPALSSAAVFIVTFAEGDSAVATAEVGTMEYYDRAVAQWSGPEGLQVHALEYGANYQEDGHVWAGAAHDIARAAKGEGGFVTRLGDAKLFNPQLAQVYTFPTGTALEAGEVQLSLEAEVTAANCGKDIEAQALQKSGTNQMQARELLIAMPACDAVGDFLVLINAFDDLNIARN